MQDGNKRFLVKFGGYRMCENADTSDAAVARARTHLIDRLHRESTKLPEQLGTVAKFKANVTVEETKR